MPQDAAPMQSTKDRPVYRNQSGSVEMAVWANTVKNSEGREITVHNMTFARNYFDDSDGQWKKSQQYGRRDLGDLSALILTAQQFLMSDTAA